MTFIWPVLLVALILVPLAVLVYLWLNQRRRSRAANIGSMRLVDGITESKLGKRRHFPPFIFLVGLTLLLFSMARPAAEVSLPRQEGTVILAFDVSGSMAADDLQTTRMEAAKAAAREFIQSQPASLQIGVVAFSESGFAVQPPTNDHQAILSSIERLSPQRSTSLSAGIIASLNAMQWASASRLWWTPTSQTPRCPLPPLCRMEFLPRQLSCCLRTGRILHLLIRFLRLK